MTSWMNAQDTLLQYGLVASVAAIVLPLGACLLARMGRAGSAVYHHMVWFWCLVGIAILPPLWLYAPKITLAILPAGSGSIEAPAAPVAAPALAPLPAPLPSFAGEGSHVSIAAEPLPFLPEGPGVPWQTVIVALWVSGTTFMLLRLAAGAWQLRRIRRCAELAELPADCMPTGGAVRLLLSDAVTGPVCFGLLHPAILLPRHMHRQASPHELRMILRHELAHIHRRDGWTNLLQRVLEAILFFHPGVWLTSRQLTQQRELICDNWVLADGVAPDDYARVLAQVAEAALAPRLQAAALFEGRLLARIKALFDPRFARLTHPSRVTWLLVSTAAIVALGGFGIVRLGSRSSAMAALPASQLTRTQPAASASRAAQAGEVIKGLVVDEKGTPAPGAQVRLLDYFMEESRATTAADGTFVLESVRPVGTTGHRTLLVGDATGSQQGLLQILSRQGRITPEVIRIVLKESRPVTVRVTDAAGKPVTGAGVEVLHGYMSIAQLQTNAQGIAQAQLPADGQVMWVMACKPGIGLDYFENYRAWPPPAKLDPLPSEIRLVLDGARTVQIKAVDSAGKGTPGVRLVPWIIRKDGKINYLNTSGSRILPAETDGKGIVTFGWIPRNLAQPSDVIIARSGEFSCPQSPIIEPGSKNLTLEARVLRSVPLTGRVTRPDGKPAAGILLQAEGRGKTNMCCRAYARTAPDGTYSMLLYPDQSYMVAVIDEQWAAPSQMGIVIREGEPRMGVDLRLGKGTVLEGIVTVGEQPAADQIITLMEQGAEVSTDLRWSPDRPRQDMPRWVSTGPDGRYRMRLGPGKYTLRGPREREAGEDILVEDQAEIVRDFQLNGPQQGPLAGTVLHEPPQEKPIAGAIVEAWPVDMRRGRGNFETIADSQGRFEVQRDLCALMIWTRSPDGSLAGLSTISADDKQVTQYLHPAGEAVGRVIDAAGNPVPGQAVQCGMSVTVTGNAPQSVQFNLRATTDEQGRYRFGGLLDGTRLHVYLSGDYTVDGVNTRPTTSAIVVLRAGSTMRLPDLKLPAKKDSVQGQPAAAQPAAARAEPEQAEQSTGDWRQEFHRVYRLEDGQVVKRIAPPFVPQRMEYYRQSNPDQAKAIPAGPDVMRFRWSGQLGDAGMMFGNGRPQLQHVLRSLGFQRYEYDGPDELLKFVVAGDWIVRDGSGPQERITALEQILRDQVNAPIYFQQRTVEREVIVARGSYRFHASDDVQPSDRRSVNIYADTADQTEGGGGGSGTFPRMLEWIGDRLNVPVVDETDSPAPVRVSWRNHQSSYLGKLPDSPQKWATVDLVLAHLAQQTSLQFTRERRAIAVWFIQPGEPTAP